MKTRLLFSAAFALLLIGCKKESPQKTILIKKQAVPYIEKKQCYAYEKEGNEISLQIELNGKDVLGSLVYSLAEKDKNAGLLRGRLENYILIAEYTFESEGKESTRQVAFKLENNKLIEGYGEMTLDGTHFKDTTQLKFGSAMPLLK